MAGIFLGLQAHIPRHPIRYIWLVVRIQSEWQHFGHLISRFHHLEAAACLKGIDGTMTPGIYIAGRVSNQRIKLLLFFFNKVRNKNVLFVFRYLKYLPSSHFPFRPSTRYSIWVIWAYNQGVGCEQTPNLYTLMLGRWEWDATQCHFVSMLHSLTQI